jgi:hypothetical protein
VAGIFRVSVARESRPVWDYDHVTLGLALRQADLLRTTAGYCEGRVAPGSIYGVLHREAVDRFCFDMRWKYAAGGLAFDYPGCVHTVLVDMRARLAASESPAHFSDRQIRR